MLSWHEPVDLSKYSWAADIHKEREYPFPGGERMGHFPQRAMSSLGIERYGALGLREPRFCMSCTQYARGHELEKIENCD